MEILDNKYLSTSISVILILYASFLRPDLPPMVKNLFNNTLFRIIVLFFVVYRFNKEPGMSIMIAASFVLTLDYVYVSNSIDTFTAVENFVDTTETEISTLYSQIAKETDPIKKSKLNSEIIPLLKKQTELSAAKEQDLLKKIQQDDVALLIKMKNNRIANVQRLENQLEYALKNEPDKSRQAVLANEIDNLKQNDTLQTTKFTPMPQILPTMSPTMEPTISPTMFPTMSPTMEPTMFPTMSPTMSPTMEPTMFPTMSPTMSPTMEPTSPTKSRSASLVSVASLTGRFSPQAKPADRSRHGTSKTFAPMTKNPQKGKVRISTKAPTGITLSPKIVQSTLRPVTPTNAPVKTIFGATLKPSSPTVLKK